ncbi:MAG: PIN domain-containing protein [Bifidobacteriaceae bacterium]|jgi:hypothetical protein|nr:PIN domain-containing protein [Bifidobacteriaceae bacterium]
MAKAVVLDACVLVPISLCDVLLELADAALFRPLWSQTILDEARRTLIGRIGMPVDRADKRINDMREAFPASMLTGFNDLVPVMRNHPKDRHVAAAAAKANCDVVTVNLRDFKPEDLSPFDIRAVDPDTFLCALFDEDPETAYRAVDRKRASYRHPPRTMAGFSTGLGKLVPTFAKRLLETGPA